MSFQRKVAIVGAGVAGIFAAGALYRSGIDFVLYETSMRLGGNTDTRTVHGTPVGISVLLLVTCSFVVDVGLLICNEVHLNYYYVINTN